jgi:hypothetical protein
MLSLSRWTSHQPCWKRCATGLLRIKDQRGNARPSEAVTGFGKVRGCCVPLCDSSFAARAQALSLPGNIRDACSGRVFCNLEHVASPTLALHRQFLAKLDILQENGDPSNKLFDLHTQLIWLREIGFEDVDCHWKWRELALLAGVRPT